MRRQFLLLLLCGLGGFHGLAAETNAPSKKTWAPPEPAPDDFDWIQLNTGEWLKGRIKGMQDRKLDFNSEKFDDQTFDWKDIRLLRSPRTIDMLFDNRKKVSGPITITPDEVIVGGSHPKTLPRNQLDSITPGGARERDHWSGKLALGLNLRSGNSDQVEYNASANLQRRTPATRLRLDYLGNISRIDGVGSANNHRVNGEFDFWLSRRLYLVIPSVEYVKDPFQNLDSRVTLGAGVGYDIIAKRALEWNITVGPAYQHSRFASVEPGEAETKENIAFTFGSRFDWEITSRIELILEYRGQYTNREVGETTHHSVATLELDLTKRLELDVSFIWDRVAQPKADANGIVPQPDDFRLTLSLGVNF